MQKIFYIQAFLSKTVVYDLHPVDKYTEEHISDTIGCFITRNVVCAAIAKGFKYLCDIYNVPCMYVTGYGNGEPHAWCMTQIGN